MSEQSDEYGDDDVIVVSITRELDLHTFAPSDIATLVPDYLDECMARGFEQVRIVHGKGKGVQRRVVHAALERHGAVVNYALAPASRGGWGATIVNLRTGDNTNTDTA